MAIVEDIPENSQVRNRDDSQRESAQLQDELNWGLRNRVPLKHPSEVRRAKPLKPLVDLGLPAETQAEVLQHIQNSFPDGPELDDAGQIEDVDEEGELDEDESDGDDVEYEQVPEEHAAEVKDPNEEFWDEFFDSLVVTVPFTFLYLLLDM